MPTIQLPMYNGPIIVTVEGQGIPGLSAYDLAVQEGFEGTLEEWLDSLSATVTDWKESVLVASGSNLTLSGEQTIDGELTSESRVLLFGQTDKSENGIWVTSSGAWARAEDADEDSEVTTGLAVAVDAGTSHVGKIFLLRTQGTIVVGTTELVFRALNTAKSSFIVYTPVSYTGHTLRLVDVNKQIAFTSSSTCTLTVPTHADVRIPLHAEIQVYRMGTGPVQIVPADGVTIRTPTNYWIQPQYGCVRLKKIGANLWELNGDLIQNATYVQYGPANVDDWDLDADPGLADDALDQLAARVADLETGAAAGGGSADWKDSVLCATTGNITLSGEQTIDGTLTSASRVLVKNQTDGSQNGIYVSAAGAWTRAEDADEAGELTTGTTVYVEEGTINGDNLFSLATNGTITIGTTVQTWKALTSPPGFFTYKPWRQSTYTLRLSDPGKQLGMETSVFTQVTIPPHTSVKIPLNSEIEVAQMGDGTVEIVAGSGVVLKSLGSVVRIADKYGIIRLKKISGNVWEITGDLRRPADTIGYTATDVTDWNGDVDPGSTADALDQLADRLNTVETSVGGTEPESIIIACSDETTALTAGTGKVTFRMPFAMTLSSVKASLTTAQTSGSIFTVDINEGGVSILSTLLTIDNTEKTSTTAATAAVISDTALAADAEITIDIDQIGDGTATGLKVTLEGTRT